MANMPAFYICYFNRVQPHLNGLIRWQTFQLFISLTSTEFNPLWMVESAKWPKCQQKGSKKDQPKSGLDVPQATSIWHDLPAAWPLESAQKSEVTVQLRFCMHSTHRPQRKKQPKRYNLPEWNCSTNRELSKVMNLRSYRWVLSATVTYGLEWLGVTRTCAECRNKAHLHLHHMDFEPKSCKQHYDVK